MIPLDVFFIKIETQTASDSACNCNVCNVCVNSMYRLSYHPLKFGDRKNRLYNPSQSPFKLDVNCGPEFSKVARKSSCLNWCGVGAALNGEMSFCSGINDAIYLSNGIIKLCVNSNRCRRNKADCTALGRDIFTPTITFLITDLSFCRYALYCVYTPGDNSNRRDELLTFRKFWPIVDALCVPPSINRMVCGQCWSVFAKNGFVTPNMTGGGPWFCWVNSLNSLSWIVKYGRLSAAYAIGAMRLFQVKTFSVKLIHCTMLNVCV